MPPNSLPTPTLTITKTDARRFMLAHHGLYPPRSLVGKTGVIDYIRHVGCIQFDPINIVGRKSDLVLQSRVNYRSNFLDELLYSERKLLDGFDKMASIYGIEDWPYFSPRRALMNQPDVDPRRPSTEIIDQVYEEVRDRGPISSLEFSDYEIVDWHWGPTKSVRAALESLFSMGKIGVHHRINNRRSFDIVQRLIPGDFLDQPEPFANSDDYQEWHILRRVGSMGLAHAKSGENWYGIIGVKSKERRSILRRLTSSGELIAFGVDEFPGQVFFLRQVDWQILEKVINLEEPALGAAFIAALDNLTWNRGMIKQIFDFEYRWEVYKPKSQRKYGYYVLPVLYGDRFVARFEPTFDKKERLFTIQNWWWEEGITPDKSMQAALKDCLQDFITYLNVRNFKLGQAYKTTSPLDGPRIYQRSDKRPESAQTRTPQKKWVYN